MTGGRLCCLFDESCCLLIYFGGLGFVVGGFDFFELLER